jgi:hypothetical protein
MCPTCSDTILTQAATTLVSPSKTNGWLMCCIRSLLIVFKVPH